MSTENEGTTPPSETPATPPVQPPADAEPTVAFDKPPAGAPAPPAQPPAPAAGPEHTAPLPPVEPPTAAYPHGHAQPPVPPAPPQAPPGAAWPPQPPAVPAYAYGAQPPVAGGWPPPPGGHPGEPAPGGKGKGRGGLIAGILVAALVAGGVGGGLGYWAADRIDRASGSTVVSASSPKDLGRAPDSIAGLAANALPSVVTIRASAGGGGGGLGDGGEGESGGTGTGFVYDEQGHILTNNHVVASAANGGKLSATFSDGKTYEAEVIGRAQGYDVAVLKLKNPPRGLKPLPLGDSDKVAVGDATIAIGAPFGLSNTVTTGIVSAKNRPVASGDGSGGKNSYMSALQTDASINPGNSGGPLLDGRGAVIGINSAIQSAGSGMGSGQPGSIGLGFAIPINQAKNVAEQLIKTGKPVYPVIGVSVDLKDRSAAGAKVSTGGAPADQLVDPNGPAGKAGLKPGDVITEFGGKPVDSGPTLIGEIWTYKPNDKVKLTYERDGKPTTVEVTLGSRTGDS
ncbi:S1C family serine protease [Streptomyces sp. BI20]|uniref:S1C family serine protease n=1 Tax=Streptomyces sp. BI20 TaxID=3403460 RepID=UPI003C76BFD8